MVFYGRIFAPGELVNGIEGCAHALLTVVKILSNNVSACLVSLYCRVSVHFNNVLLPMWIKVT